ncbi:MAG: hypothetical protein ACTHNS_09105 [Marmoricola sp.]
MSDDDVRATAEPTADLPDEEVARIEAEREQRLASENRPEGAEVDNTARDFDSEAGAFTDSPGYDPNDRPFDDAAGESGAARAAHGRGAGAEDDVPDDTQASEQEA